MFPGASIFVVGWAGTKNCYRRMLPTAALKCCFAGSSASFPPASRCWRQTRIGPLLTTPLLSLRGKLRLLAEPLIPSRATAEDESLASFGRRRLGREVFERIVQPLVGGIYTADPERLSLAATLPRFLQMEREHGSLLFGANRDSAADGVGNGMASGARYGMFVAPRGGMSSLVDALAARLPKGAVRLAYPNRRNSSAVRGRLAAHLAGHGPSGGVDARGRCRHRDYARA